MRVPANVVLGVPSETNQYSGFWHKFRLICLLQLCSFNSYTLRLQLHLLTIYYSSQGINSSRMRFPLISLGLMAISTLATPVPVSVDATAADTLEDVATVGFATMNGGTSGGKGGKVVEVATLSQLTAAVQGDTATIVLVTGPMTGSGENVKIGSNKSVIGKDASVSTSKSPHSISKPFSHNKLTQSSYPPVLTNFTLTAKNVHNVIIRNVIVKKVVGGDAIAVQYAQNVWIDHCDLSSDRDHDKDYYDGLLDITHAVDYVTVTNTFFHDHWKCSLVGHSNNNGAQDKGHLTVTYAFNYWLRINSRTPSLRFGTGHIYNNYYDQVLDGINTRIGAQVLVQNNVFVGANKALYDTDVGYAVANGNDWGNSSNTALVGTFTKAPYAVPTLLPASEVEAAVVGGAGATLKF